MNDGKIFMTHKKTGKPVKRIQFYAKNGILWATVPKKMGTINHAILLSCASSVLVVGKKTMYFRARDIAYAWPETEKELERLASELELSL